YEKPPRALEEKKHAVSVHNCREFRRKFRLDPALPKCLVFVSALRKNFWPRATMNTNIKSIRLAAGLAALLCAAINTTPAATLTVTNIADSGAGSLRSALTSANNGD